MNKTSIVSILVILIYSLNGCNQEPKPASPAVKGLPKSQPQTLGYETVSVLLSDMNAFNRSVRSRDTQTVRKVEDSYRGVIFAMTQPPLLYNVYGDPAGGRVVFVVYPKDPRTGSNYLLRFDKSLPVVNVDTIEIQIRTKDPEQPLNCLMQVSDPEAYLKEYKDHTFEAEYTFTKQFLQSGTFDFDSLTVPGYRTHGHPFVVLDMVKMKLNDRTANLSTECRQ